MAYDAMAKKHNEEALRLLHIAQKYYPADLSLQADIMELER